MPQGPVRLLATLASALLTIVVLMPSTADAARLTKAEKVAWNRASVSCKAEAKAKKLGWFARRKFAKACIAESLKGYPNVNVEKLMKAMDTGKLPRTYVEWYM